MSSDADRGARTLDATELYELHVRVVRAQNVSRTLASVLCRGQFSYPPPPLLLLSIPPALISLKAPSRCHDGADDPVRAANHTARDAQDERGKDGRQRACV
jgi:hypothetical protein